MEEGFICNCGHMSGIPLTCVICNQACCIYCTHEEAPVCKTCCDQSVDKEALYCCNQPGCFETTNTKYCHNHKILCMFPKCKIEANDLPKKVCSNHLNTCFQCRKTTVDPVVCVIKNCGVSICGKHYAPTFPLYNVDSRYLPVCRHHLSNCSKSNHGQTPTVGYPCIFEGCENLCCGVCDSYNFTVCCISHVSSCEQCFLPFISKENVNLCDKCKII